MIGSAASALGEDLCNALTILANFMFEIVFILALVILNGVFSMSELAVVSSRKARLQSEAAEGDRRARAALDLASAPHAFLSTVQIGITLIGILAGVYGGATVASKLAAVLRGIDFIDQYADVIAYGLVVGIITYLSVVVGELLPKRLALAYPEGIAKAVSAPMRALSRLFFPIVRLLEGSTDFVFRLIPVRPSSEPVVTEDEIRHFIAQGSEAGTIEKAEEQIVNKVFRLGDRTAASVMTPRNDLVWVDITSSARVIWEEVRSVPHSFFPAGRGTIEEFVGVLAIKDLAAYLLDGRTDPLDTVLREALKVPSTISALQVLDSMKREKKQIAIVIDEHGSIDGLITMHDLMEAMVGEIPEEGDTGPEIVQRSDGSYLVDATVDIDDVFRLLNLPLLHEEENPGYHSLGGFLLSKLGHIPTAGEKLAFSEFVFEVVDMDRNRIDKVLVARGQAAGSAPKVD